MPPKTLKRTPGDNTRRRMEAYLLSREKQKAKASAKTLHRPNFLYMHREQIRKYWCKIFKKQKTMMFASDPFVEKTVPNIIDEITEMLKIDEDESDDEEYTGVPITGIDNSKSFSAIINLHGGYNTYIDTAGNLKGYTTDYKHERIAVHIAPLGAPLWGSAAENMFVTDLVFKKGWDPVSAAMYMYTPSYLSIDHGIKPGKPPQVYAVTDKLFHEHVDEAFQQYELNWVSRTTQIKHYQQDLPNGIPETPTYGYPQCIGKRDIDKDCIGMVISSDTEGLCNGGYFLLEEFTVTFTMDGFGILNTIITAMCEALGIHLVNGFAEHSSLIYDKDSDNMHVTYPRGFNITQCKYFIAYMLHLRMGLENYATTEAVSQVKAVLGHHMTRIEPTGILIPPNYKATDSNSPFPFLVRTLDAINAPPGAQVFTYMNQGRGIIRMLDSENVCVLTKYGTPPIQITTHTHPKEDYMAHQQIAFPTYIGKHALHKDGTVIQAPDKTLTLNTCKIKHRTTNVETFYKYAVFQASDKNIMDFIGDKDDLQVKTFNINCSCLSVPSGTTKEQAYAYYEASTFVARGSMKSNSKTRRKYKRKRERKKRKTRR